MSFKNMKTGLADVDHRATPRKLEAADLEHMRLPTALWRVRVDQIPSNVRDVLIGYINEMPKTLDEGISVLLQGDRGVGKTCAAAVLAIRARAWRKTVLFTTYAHLRDARRSPNEVIFDADRQETLWHRARTVQVLVLDAVTQEDMEDRYYGKTEFLRLVEERAIANRVTIVTTSEVAYAADTTTFPGVLLGTIPKLVGLTLLGPNRTLQNNQDLVLQLAHAANTTKTK